MSLSSFTVCMNALRLNLFNLHDASRDKPRRHGPQPSRNPENPAAGTACPATCPLSREKEAPADTVTVRVGGMMCGHCEAAVKKALEALDFVSSATASHEAGTAVLTLCGEMDEDAVRQAIGKEDYEYLGIAGTED